LMPNQLSLIIKKEEQNKLFKEFYQYKTLSSTNETAKKLIQNNGVANYFVVTSETQTQGKGRWGRKWLSPPGGLWCSLVLPEISVPSLRATFSAVQTIRKLTSLTPGIRWPNDIIIGDKKIGGVLTEFVGNRHTCSLHEKLIIGVGININQPNLPSELKNATSLRIELRKGGCDDFITPTLQEFLVEFLDNFEKNLVVDEIVDKIREFLLLLGERVTVKVKDIVKTGEFFDIGSDGSLFLREPTGIISKLAPSEVEFIR